MATTSLTLIEHDPAKPVDGYWTDQHRGTCFICVPNRDHRLHFDFKSPDDMIAFGRRIWEEGKRLADTDLIDRCKMTLAAEEQILREVEAAFVPSRELQHTA